MAEKQQTNITDKTYSVGYARPPKHGQFQKGVSGNPGGRPEGARGVVTMLRELLQESAVITENRKRRSVTKVQAMLISLVNRAISGDTTAFKLVMGLLPDREFERVTDPIDVIKTDEGLLVPNAIFHRRAVRELEHLYGLKRTDGDVSHIVLTKEQSIELAKRLSEAWGCRLSSEKAVELANTSLLVKEADEQAESNNKTKVGTGSGPCRERSLFFPVFREIEPFDST